MPYTPSQRLAMEKVSIEVQKEFCDECALALRRFLGRIDEVKGIDVERGNIVISFDTAKMSREDMGKITQESIEKLGYKVSSPSTKIR
jgi:copper chaperone CopZ